MLIPIELRQDRSLVPASMGLSTRRDLDRLTLSPGRLLSRGELDRFCKLPSAVRRTSYLLGRHAVKQAIGHLLDEPDLSRMEILSGTFSQPVLKYVCDAPPEISLTHSQGLGLGMAAEQGYPIGMDLECIDPGRTDALRGCFSTKESDMARQTGLPEESSLFVLWTIKESLSKVLKCGLTVPLEILAIKSILPGGHGEYVSQFANFAQYQARSWLFGSHAFSIVLSKRMEVRFRPPASAFASGHGNPPCGVGRGLEMEPGASTGFEEPADLRNAGSHDDT